MEFVVPIRDRDEYEFAKSQGFEPLIDTKNFRMDIALRVEVQKELFGHCTRGRADNIMRANERFYRWVWAHKPHYCEESMRPLTLYSASYISHILTRGAFPEMAHDPRNVNILSFEMHNKWENGNRKAMRIYEKNQRTIEMLKEEYNEYHKIKI